MYQFKVGDTVRPKSLPHIPAYVIQEIIDGWCRKNIGDPICSYQAGKLELVCPAGYRPVREDEMGQHPQADDVHIHMGQIVPITRKGVFTFGQHVGYTTFYRPIQQKRDYGWYDEFSNDCQNGESGLTEEAAKAAAEKFSKENSVETFVYKIVGKFTVKKETKVVWNEA